MDKKHRPGREGSQGVQITSSPEVTPDSGPAGSRSEKMGLYINERGETCYGDNCFTLAIDKDRREVRVNIKRDPVCPVNELVKDLKEVLDAGDCRTVYEVESVAKK